ncbi:hypothetical protein [Pontibacillus salipaludis]|uniref:hypothetical protein n=1 Tax=Pontibacillus salipaludis TaxID=1697394 RepID=UPI0031EDFD6B
MKFWIYVFLTIAIEISVAYVIHQAMVDRGLMYTVRKVVRTDYLQFPIVLLFVSLVCSAFSLGTLRERETGEVQSLPAYFLSFIKHPITFGSVSLFMLSFFLF